MAILKNTIVENVTQLPSSSTDDRPVSPNNGSIRFNTQSSLPEKFIQSWQSNPGIITEGLEFYLDFSNPSCYSGSGTTVTDLSFNRYSRGWSGDTFHTLDGGGSIQLDGSFDYVNFDGDLNQDNGRDPFRPDADGLTAMILCKPTAFQTGVTNHSIGNVVLSNASKSVNDNFELGYTSDGRIEVYVDDVSNDVDVETDIPVGINEWHTVTVIYNVNNNPDLFVLKNASEIWSVDLGFSGLDDCVNSNAAVGGSLHEDEYFTGNIAAVTYHNRALTFEEVKNQHDFLFRRIVS